MATNRVRKRGEARPIQGGQGGGGGFCRFSGRHSPAPFLKPVCRAGNFPRLVPATVRDKAGSREEFRNFVRFAKGLSGITPRHGEVRRVGSASETKAA